MVKSWHRRWFVLNGDCLFYFAKEDDLKALGTIFLPGNKIIQHPANPDEPDKFLMEIVPGRIFLFRLLSKHVLSRCCVSGAQSHRSIMVVFLQHFLSFLTKPYVVGTYWHHPIGMILQLIFQQSNLNFVSNQIKALKNSLPLQQTTFLQIKKLKKDQILIYLQSIQLIKILIIFRLCSR